MAPTRRRFLLRFAVRPWLVTLLLPVGCTFEPAHLPTVADAAAIAAGADVAERDTGGARPADAGERPADAGVPDRAPADAPPDAASPDGPGPDARPAPPTPEQIAFGCPPDPALRACYSFDGDGDAFADGSGQGNAGMRNSADVTAGVRTMALRFSDGQKFAIVPDAPSLRLAGTAATFEAWIRPTASGLDGRVDFIAGKWTRDNLGYLFGIYDSRLAINRSGGTGSKSDGQLKLMAWAHVAVVLTATEVIMYMDGSRVMAVPPAALELMPNTEPLTIGNRNPAQNADAPALTAFYGDLDVLRIYARPKRPDEICADAGRAWNDGLCIGTLITPQ